MYYIYEVTNLTAKKITLVDGSIIKPYGTKRIKVDLTTKAGGVEKQIIILKEAGQVDF